MAGNNNEKTIIRDINDIARLFVRQLKELSEENETVTLDALTGKLAKCEELKSLIDLANERRETLAQPILEDEVERLKTRLAEKENERKRLVNQLFHAEHKLDMEKDFNKRLFFSLYRLVRIEESRACHSLLEEYKNLLLEEADLREREDLLKRLKNRIMKIDVDPAREGSFIKGFLGDRSDPLKQIKKGCIRALSELRTVIGNEYSNDIEEIKKRIKDSYDVEYVVSQRKSVLNLIERFAEKTEKAKEEVTGFLKEIGNRLVALEKTLAVTSADMRENCRNELDFNESLRSDISRMRAVVQDSGEFDELKAFVLDHLDAIGNVLTRKRDEYVIRVKNITKENEKLMKHFEEAIAALRDKNRQLEEQSSKDPLTGIWNRRVFEERLAAEFERFKRYRTPFSILFFDIDHFKNINDTFGHSAGDRALKGIATHTEKILRKIDVFARYGGEEFVVILYETGVPQAVTVAEKLRRLIETAEFKYRSQRVPLTVSIGVTEARDTDEDPEEIIRRADKYLYKAKQTGRNRVVSDLDETEGEEPEP